jgi:TRAP transporter 4TM/12TM fusion protein
MKNNVASFRKIAIYIVSCSFVLFHLYTAAFGVLDGLSQRNIHLTMAILMAILFTPCKIRYIGCIYDAILISLALISGYYLFTAAPGMAYRAGTVYWQDKACCLILIVLILVNVKRTMGYAMPLIASFMLLYVFYGQYLPQPYGHAPYSMKKIASLLYMGTEGIWSSPIAASATFIPLFILFGSMLESFGGGKFFMDLSSALFGKYRGGPAKVSVISSGLMGSISGSAVANVTTTGAFTIPLMKKMGYDKNFAGAVEAVASTGGQLAPPVMGAAAFLMSEILAIPYGTIVTAAIIPALLYYSGCFFVVDIEAARLHLAVMKKEDLPNLKKVIKEGWYHLFPLGMLIYMLVFSGTSALKASLSAVVATLVIALIVGGVKHNLRLESFVVKLGDIVVNTGKSCVTVAMATSCAGVIVGSFAVTGLGTKLSSLIITMAGGNLLVVLVFTAVAAIILGMGLPTVAAYSILVTLVVSSLVKMGVEALAAHMFIFYFGIISNVTPPVALAAYAAAGLSGGSVMHTGIKATKLALAGFIIPFLFIYDHGILMVGNVANIMAVSVTALAGIYALSVASVGYWFISCTVLERLACLVAGILLVIPNVKLSLIGGIVLVSIGLLNKRHSLMGR